MTTIVVAGALANRCHNGGGAWVRLSWVLGLKRLGFDVFFLEQIPSCGFIDSTGVVNDGEGSVKLAYFRDVTERFGLGGAAALIYDGGAPVYGASSAELLDLATRSALLVNLGGHLDVPHLLDRFSRKVYIDLDPGFTHFWHAAGNAGGRLAGHDFYFTVGENVGRAGCIIPTGNIVWRHTRPPVVLEEWPTQPQTSVDRFTTVAHWRGPFGPVEYGGRTFGLKVHQFRKFIELPRHVPGTFELSLNIHPADEKDRLALSRNGWLLVDPRAASATPDAFRTYVQGSSAEFSVAQGVYVDTGSGWFSDRTATYLASGKPVLVQDTGFSANLPEGEGLVAFRTLEEAVLGAERIAGDYAAHSRAARALAEEYFDSDKILSRLLEDVLV